MSIRSKFAKTTAASLAGVMALTAVAAVPAFAQAQGYDSDGYYYDPCKRDKTNRATVGGVIGALAGAAIGSNVAARGVRTEGALLGGAAGAVGGAMIGNRSAACESGYAPPRSSYYREAPAYYSERRPDPYYDRSYDRSRYYDDRERYADSYTVVDRPAAAPADDCTLAESPIMMPDGRTQKRFVRVCRDNTGRYQVVE